MKVKLKTFCEGKWKTIYEVKLKTIYEVKLKAIYAVKLKTIYEVKLKTIRNVTRAHNSRNALAFIRFSIHKCCSNFHSSMTGVLSNSQKSCDQYLHWQGYEKYAT